MNASDFEPTDRIEKKQGAAQSRIDDRQGLLGFIALTLLAIPALIIRNLFPEMNPLILAGIGLTVYAVYLGMMVMALSTQLGQEEPSLEPVPITVDED